MTNQIIISDNILWKKFIGKIKSSALHTCSDNKFGTSENSFQLSNSWIKYNLHQKSADIQLQDKKSCTILSANSFAERNTNSQAKHSKNNNTTVCIKTWKTWSVMGHCTEFSTVVLSIGQSYVPLPHTKSTLSNTNIVTI